jgi:hypothetical protein
VGTPHRGCLCPYSQQESSVWHVCAERPLQNQFYTCVYSNRNVHIYCQNKVSILLLLVLI